MIRRGKAPFEGCLAFPGGHFEVETDESIEFAAHRELLEETGIDADPWFFDYVDEKGRDPRGRYVTFVFTHKFRENRDVVKVGDDAMDFFWYNPKIHVEPLAFDHAGILNTFMFISNEYNPEWSDHAQPEQL